MNAPLDAIALRERLLSQIEGDEPLDLRQRNELLRSLLGENQCRRLGIYDVDEQFVLSVVIPIFNEVETLDEIIRRVRNSGVRCEMVLVDDGSTDGTRELLKKYAQDDDVAVVLHEQNRGKGAALRTGFLQATGDIVVIQDADLEYDPAEFLWLIQPIVEGNADVVYGSRFSGNNQRVLYFWHYVGNRLLTLLSNMFSNLNLTDMETCYKAFRREVIADLAPTLREDRFGIEPEMTAKVAKQPGVRIYERPISYAGRTYEQGKKITWRDGLQALWCILRY